jgi:hypothetical protein
MMSTATHDITADIHEFAPDFTLSAVLMSTAVVGNQPKIPVAIFAAATHIVS